MGYLSHTSPQKLGSCIQNVAVTKSFLMVYSGLPRSAQVCSGLLRFSSGLVLLRFCSGSAWFCSGSAWFCFGLLRSTQVSPKFRNVKFWKTVCVDLFIQG